MNVVLVGFMASGKTAIGRQVAKRLGYRLVDTDHFIETQTGRAIADIFQQEGEPYFRGLESALTRAMATMENTVFSTGGGILTTPGNLERLKQVGLVVYLKADTADILERLERDTRRPLVQKALAEGNLKETVETLLAQREPQYLQADVTVSTHGKAPFKTAGEIIQEISKRLKQGP